MRNTVNRLPCPIPFMSVGAVFAVLLFLTAIDVADADMVPGCVGAEFKVSNRFDVVRAGPDSEASLGVTRTS